MRPSTWAGTPETRKSGSLPRRSGQFFRTRSMVAADAARGHEDRLRLAARRRPWRRGTLAGTAGDRCRLEDIALHPVDDAACRRQAVRRGGGSGSETRPRAAAARTLTHEGRDEARPGAPGHMEARHRIAVAGGEPAAPLRPTDEGEPAHPALVQPGTLLAMGEVHIGLGPAPRPVVLGPVEAGGALPVLPGEVETVADAHPPLLGTIDEEQPAEATRTPGRRVFCSPS